MKHPQSSFGRALLQDLLLVSVMIALALLQHETAIQQARSEFSALQLKGLSRHILAILAIQGLAYLIGSTALRRLTAEGSKARRVLPIVFAALLTLNMLSLQIFHMSGFQGLQTIIKYLLVVAIFGVLFLLVQALRAKLWISVAAFVLIGVNYGWIKNATLNAPTEMASIAGERVRPLDDLRRRNLYLISFDSLIPPALGKELLGIDILPYMSAIEGAEFYQFKNGFSIERTTKDSLNGILSLQPSTFRELPEDQKYLYYAGQTPAPLAQVMQRLGYKFQTLYSSAYLGAAQGPYIDYYGIPANLDGACDHVASDWVFLGFCKPALAKMFRTRMPASNGGADIADQSYPGLLFERIQKTAAESQPWVTMAHIYMPGHTAPGYRNGDPQQRAEFKAYFKDRSETAGTYIQTLIDLLKAHDPDAVLMIYGDHGAMVSRAMGDDSFGSANITSLSDRDFRQRDRHGILIATWPETACAQDMAGERERSFITSTEVVRGLVRCLAGSAAPQLEGDLKLSERSQRIFDRFEALTYE